MRSPACLLLRYSTRYAKRTNGTRSGGPKIWQVFGGRRGGRDYETRIAARWYPTALGTSGSAAAGQQRLGGDQSGARWGMSTGVNSQGRALAELDPFVSPNQAMVAQVPVGHVETIHVLWGPDRGGCSSGPLRQRRHWLRTPSNLHDEVKSSDACASGVGRIDLNGRYAEQFDRVAVSCGPNSAAYCTPLRGAQTGVDSSN